MRRSLLLLVLAACGSPAEREAVASKTELVAAVVPRPAPSPGEITAIALTDAGDAAFTLDSAGEARLWPTLDGTQPPVPVAVPAALDVALAHAGTGFVVGVVDHAGLGQLLVLGRAGDIRRTVSLGDGEIDQIVALGEGLLVRRADQTLERYDASGKRVAVLAPVTGERVIAIAERGGAAIAAIGDDPQQIHELRWIGTDSGLAWGAELKLPRYVIGASLALAPGHRRVAALTTPGEAQTTGCMIVDLSPTPREIRAGTDRVAPTALLGFVTDNRLAIDAPGVPVQWWAIDRSDPWAGGPDDPAVDTSATGVAFADGVLATGYGDALAVTTNDHVHYLGWSGLANGELASAGEHTVVVGNQLTWIDDALQAQRDVSLDQLPGERVTGGIAVGPHHLVTQRQQDGKTVLELVNLDDPRFRVRIGAIDDLARLDLDDSGTILAATQSGKLEIARWQLDLQHDTATALAPIKLADNPTLVRLLDPARAGGLVAITVGYRQSTLMITSYRAGAGAGSRRTDDMAVAIDREGTVYEVSPAPQTITASRGDKVVAKMTVDSPIREVTPSRDATQVVAVGTNELELFDAGGARRWQRSLWAVTAVAFTADDRRIIARTEGGIVLLDAATGAPVGKACGWSFGLHDRAPIARTFTAATVCEDPAIP